MGGIGKTVSAPSSSMGKFHFVFKFSNYFSFYKYGMYFLVKIKSGSVEYKDDTNTIGKKSVSEN